MNSNPLKIIAVAAFFILILAGATLLTMRMVHSSHVAAMPKISGAWSGTLDIKGGQAEAKLRLVLNVTNINGTYKATLDSIDQGAKDFPVDKFTYDYPNIGFEITQLKVSYTAKVNPGVTEISGTFKQAGGKMPLKLERTTEPPTIAAPLAETDFAPRKDSDLQGYWKGTLKVGQLELRLDLKIAEQADGTFRAQLDSIDQGAKNLAPTSVTYSRPTLTMAFDGLGASYQGEVNGSDTKITGTWKQGGQPSPLEFARAEIPAESTSSEKNYSATGKNDLQGHWQGTLNVSGTKLRLKFDIAQLPDGTYSGNLVSLDQGAAQVPATSVTYTAPDADLEWKGIAASFKGKVVGGKLSGNWKQGNASFPFVLDRIPK